MRKIAAILLILILFFNLGGYRIIFPVLQGHADRKLESLLDNNEYDESRLIEIKMALNMPYQMRFTDYERHYGQIEVDGQSYTYVKRKVEGDSVTFKCIANESKQQLKGLQQDMTRANSAANTDHPDQSKQPSSSLVKNVLSDYDDHNQFHLLVAFASCPAGFSPGHHSFIPSITTNTPHQPPEC